MSQRPKLDYLSQLALKYGTDKWGSHFYTTHYSKFFESIRNKNLKILEIGVGGGGDDGYKNQNAGGHSLRMWKEYFPNSEIYAIDIVDKTKLSEERITIFKGSQVDNEFLFSINKNYGPFDIIIDDGSHMNQHIIKTFKILFPLLADNGFYAVEDLQTSYWKAFGGNSFNYFDKKTAMNFFKNATDSLNYKEFDNPYYKPTYLDKNLKSINFYHNLVILEKGINIEESNIVKYNRISKDNIKSKIKYLIVHALYLIFGKRKF